MAGAYIYHRALAFFFAQDDFAGLARAAGLAPRLQPPFRYLSQQVFFDLMWPLASTNPLPYHLMSLLLHLGCGILIYQLLRRRASQPAALVGALFFVAHPALFTAVYWISAISDNLALFLALCALLLALERGRRRLAALPLFALSLMAKETTLLLPVVIAAQRCWPGAAGRASPRGDRNGPLPNPERRADTTVIVIGTSVISAVYLAHFIATNGMGFRQTADSSPYAVGFGMNVVWNSLTYLGWTANFYLPTVRAFSDATDPLVYPWALGTALLWLLGLGSKSLRQRGWALGGAIFVLFLLPVLALRNHTYHYYLYAPLVGAACCVAAMADAALASVLGGSARSRLHARMFGRRSHAAWAIAASLGAALTINGSMLVRKVETHPFVIPEMRSDPIVDRARIARKVYDGLERAGLPPGSRLVFWSPYAGAISPEISAEYWETNVRTALAGGLAVRVLLPEVAEVLFVDEYHPEPLNTFYALYHVDGTILATAPSESLSSLAVHPGRPAR